MVVYRPTVHPPSSIALLHDPNFQCMVTRSFAAELGGPDAARFLPTSGRSRFFGRSHECLRFHARRFTLRCPPVWRQSDFEPDVLPSHEKDGAWLKSACANALTDMLQQTRS
jgi:hypothetical protein